jgi:hypothetical protein
MSKAQTNVHKHAFEQEGSFECKCKPGYLTPKARADKEACLPPVNSTNASVVPEVETPTRRLLQAEGRLLQHARRLLQTDSATGDNGTNGTNGTEEGIVLWVHAHVCV